MRLTQFRHQLRAWLTGIFVVLVFGWNCGSAVLAAPKDDGPIDQPAPPPECPQIGVDPDNDLLTTCEESLYSNTDPNDWDSDDDSMFDGYEVSHGLDPNVADPDNDGDGWPDVKEVLLNQSMLYWYPDGSCYADPDDADTDGDRIVDQADVGPVKGDCSWNDSDNDGLLNPEEAAYGTDPWDSDTDGDGFNDPYEINWGSDPLNPRSVPRS